MLGRLYGELLTSGRIQTREGQEAGLSTTSVRLVHVTIHRMLKDAVRRGLLGPQDRQGNDAGVVARGTAGLPRRCPWQPSERHVDAAHHDGCVGERSPVFAGLGSTSRPVTSRLSARVVVDHKVIESSPKTDRSSRSLALDPVTIAALRSHRARQSQERLKWGAAYQGTNLVFTWEDGSPLHPNVISRTFTRLAKAAGLPAIRLHDLRHSYASAGLSAGGDLKVMQERLGHSSVAITGDIYSYVSREVDQAAADRVAAVILGGAS